MCDWESGRKKEQRKKDPKLMQKEKKNKIKPAERIQKEPGKKGG